MTIWQITPDINNFYSLGLVDSQNNWERTNDGFRGSSLKADWKALEVFVENISDKLRLGNFPSLVGIPVFDSKALANLEKLSESYGEFLPLICSDNVYERLWAYNVTKVIDCLDQSKSIIKRFDDGKVMWIPKIVLKLETVTGVHIFKIPEDKRNFVFVSDTFKDIVEKNELLGLLFSEVETS